MRRGRRDVNTSRNVIRVVDNGGVMRDVVLQTEGLTPGCAVVSTTGTDPLVPSGFDGSTGNMEGPSSATGNLPLAFVDISSADGGNLTKVYRAGDSATVWFPPKGGQINVRVQGDAIVTVGTLLTPATDGSGLMTVGTAANAVGQAIEDIIDADTSLPTFVVMEVF